MRTSKLTCISTMSTLHVCINTAQRDVQVQVKSQDNSGEQCDKGCESSIFEVSELYLHASKLGSPSDVGIVGSISWRRRLPANCLPMVRNMKMRRMVVRRMILKKVAYVALMTKATTLTSWYFEYFRSVLFESRRRPLQQHHQK